MTQAEWVYHVPENWVEVAFTKGSHFNPRKVGADKRATCPQFFQRLQHRNLRMGVNLICRGVVGLWLQTVHLGLTFEPLYI